MRKPWRLASIGLASLCGVAATSTTFAGNMQPPPGSLCMSQNQLYEALLDALYATFGNHPGFRVAHAKGVLVAGSFTASAEAKTLSRAEHLQGQVVPVVMRFSNFSGIPSTVDGDPTASPHGLAVRFSLPDGAVTDIVTHSFNGFPVATPEDFLSFLQGIAATVGDSPDSEPLDAFLAGHPQARRFLETPKPAPQSYAGLEYFGVNTFWLLNKEGQQKAVRYRIEPLQDLPVLRDEEAAQKPPDYLQAELSERLAKGRVKLRLVVQLASDEDNLVDGSVAWPQSNEEVELGTFTLDALIPTVEQQPSQQRLDFNPGRLLDGVAASNDPMIVARQLIYESAMERRNQH
jgi:catalase